MSKTRYPGGSDRVSLKAEANDINFGSQLNNYLNDIHTFFTGNVSSNQSWSKSQHVV